MKRIAKLWIGLSIALSLLACSDKKGLENESNSSENLSSSSAEVSSSSEKVLTQAETIAKNLGLGINLGNALEAPSEGAWGVTLEAEYFKLIADSGFKHVRIPARWDTHLDTTSGVCLVDTAFMARVKWAVEEALKNGLLVVLDQHHYAAMYEATLEEETPCFLSIWKQIATELKSVSKDSLVFELLNEPRDYLNATRWNPLVLQTIDTIRSVSADRTVMVGGDSWNSVDGMTRLQLPEADKNIIATFHFYEPHAFTHQGADWTTPIPPVGTTWTATAAEKQAIRASFDKAYQWGIEHERPIYVGEFGAYSMADSTSRAIWTEFVSSEARRLGISAAYWEFCSGFGVYDATNKVFRSYLMSALLHPTLGFDSEIKRPNLDTTAYILLDDFDSLSGETANVNNISKLLTLKAGLPLDSSKGRWYAYHNSESRVFTAAGDTLVTGDLIRFDSLPEGTKEENYKLIADNGHTGSGIYAKMRLVGTSYPYIGVGVNIDGDTEYDYKNMVALSFWARGKGDIRVAWVESFTDTCCANSWGKFGKDIVLTDSWKQYVIWYDQWTPSPWSDLEAQKFTWMEHTLAGHLQFANAASYGMEVDAEIELQVDDVRFYGMAPLDFGL